jgi:hypothetical protein
MSDLRQNAPHGIKGTDGLEFYTTALQLKGCKDVTSYIRCDYRSSENWREQPIMNMWKEGISMYLGNTECKGVEWICLDQHRDQLRALVNIRFKKRRGWAPVGFPRTLPHAVRVLLIYTQSTSANTTKLCPVNCTMADQSAPATWSSHGLSSKNETADSKPVRTGTRTFPCVYVILDALTCVQKCLAKGQFCVHRGPPNV